MLAPSAVAFVVWLLAASVTAAQAGLVTAALQEVGISPPAGARVPLESRWTGETGTASTLGEAIGGRPALLIFADYTCSTLCGPVLTFVSDALAQSGLAPADYRVVVLGLDAKDGPRAAATMKQRQVGDDGVASATIMLTADAQTIRAVADAVGYRFSYDAEHDQFAHPAAVLALTGDGRVSRVVSGLGTSADDLRLALVEASDGHIGTLRDHVRLLCYGFDPSAGVYTLSVYRGLSIAAALTVIALAAAIGFMSLRPRRAS